MVLLDSIVWVNVLAWIMSLVIVVSVSLHTTDPNMLHRFSPDIGVRVNRANSASSGSSPRKLDRGEPVGRARSNSVSVSPPAHHAARKRTSSGVFQIDDAEPPPKKIELKRSNSDTEKIALVQSSSGKDKKSDVVSNGRRKTEGDKDTANNTEKEKKIAEKEKKVNPEKEKKVIPRFDAAAKTKCVSVFKESDSWD